MPASHRPVVGPRYSVLHCTCLYLPALTRGNFTDADPSFPSKLSLSSFLIPFIFQPPSSTQPLLPATHSSSPTTAFKPPSTRSLLLLVLRPPHRLNATTMIPTATGRTRPLFLALFYAVLLLFSTTVEASVGDRLPEFRECVEVRD